eukprot:2104676-Prymnesium_polylepis.2
MWNIRFTIRSRNGEISWPTPKGRPWTSGSSTPMPAFMNVHNERRTCRTAEHHVTTSTSCIFHELCLCSSRPMATSSSAAFTFYSSTSLASAIWVSDAPYAASRCGPPASRKSDASCPCPRWTEAETRWSEAETRSVENSAMKLFLAFGDCSTSISL